MSRKSPQLSITLTPEAAAAAEKRCIGLTGNRSSTISAMLQRYAHICERCVPDLTEAEWNLCRDALNGVWMLEHPCSWSRASIEDHVRLNGADKRFEVDWSVMRAKLERLDEGGWTALVDSVERWWMDARPAAEEG